MLPQLRVDRGAIKFVLSGANIMCPGLTSKGARMDVELPAESMVAIMAEGKENALAIGWLKMSTNDMYVIAATTIIIHLYKSKCETLILFIFIYPFSRKINKGIGCDNVHYLADTLWKETVHV